MIQLELIVLSLLLSALFSGMEIAFISANKLRVELNKNKGENSAKIISRFMDRPSHFISTMLVGNNIALVAFSSLMSIYLTQQFGIGEGDAWSLLVKTLITTFVVLLIGEFIPKTFFRLNPDKILSFLAWPVKYLIYYPLKPLSWLFVKSSQGVIGLFMRTPINETGYELSEADLRYFVRESSSNISEAADNAESDELNTEFFEKALVLKEIKVRECMVPRTEIVGIEANVGIDGLKEKLIESKHSRVIIYEESMDNILGYAHHFELLKMPDKIEDIMFEIPVVPETMSARDLLYLFIRVNKSIAWVVDEYGGTAGIVTLEDVMEEIFGEIQDEHDEDEFVERKLGTDEYIFSGRLETDYLNEKYDLDIPQGEYETLAGYVVTRHEDIPDAGEEIVLDHFHIKILGATDNRIDTLRIKKILE